MDFFLDEEYVSFLCNFIVNNFLDELLNSLDLVLKSFLSGEKEFLADST